MIRRRPVRTAISLDIALEEFEPRIWRIIAVDERTTLSDLHCVLQIAFGWLDYHLFDFEVEGKRYEDPDPEAEGGDATAVTLASLGLGAGDVFHYRYDFGDGWTLRIEVRERLPADRNEWLPMILDGGRAGPPEDCGGPGGLAALLEALEDPGHPEHGEYRDWVGEDYDPTLFDRRAANSFLWLSTGWGVIGPEPEEED
jgi:hypothetical protein